MGDGPAALWGWRGWSIPPACDAAQTYEQTSFAPAFLAVEARILELVSVRSVSVRSTCGPSTNFRESRGLNSLSGHASLRIPFRPVSRPAQEERLKLQTKEKLASNHLTNEPIRVILQGCRRIGTRV